MNADELQAQLKKMQQGELDKAARAYENALQNGKISEMTSLLEFHLLKAQNYEDLQNLCELLSTEWQGFNYDARQQRGEILRALRWYRKAERRLIKHARAHGLSELL